MKWPGDLTRLPPGWAGDGDGDDCQDRELSSGDEALGTFLASTVRTLDTGSSVGDTWPLLSRSLPPLGCAAPQSLCWSLNNVSGSRFRNILLVVNSE